MPNLWTDLEARDYQILFLTSFLLLGVLTRDWTLQPLTVGVAIATCLLTQQFWYHVTHCPWLQNWGLETPSHPALKSALITSLGLSLLLRTDHPLTMAIAAFLAISSKFVFQLNGKHWFNPANFGIVGAMLLTHQAWVSPGQWGDEIGYGLLFLGAGGIVLQRVGRWDTSVAFLLSYGGLEAARNLWLGWTWDVWAHRMMNGSLILFALFMITDPRSIPNSRTGRLVWAGAIALLTFVLRNFFFLSTAVFWALFVLAPVTVLLDFLWQDTTFTWKPSFKAIAATTPSLNP